MSKIIIEIKFSVIKKNKKTKTFTLWKNTKFLYSRDGTCADDFASFC